MDEYSDVANIILHVPALTIRFKMSTFRAGIDDCRASEIEKENHRALSRSLHARPALDACNGDAAICENVSLSHYRRVAKAGAKFE